MLTASLATIHVNGFQVSISSPNSLYELLIHTKKLMRNRNFVSFIHRRMLMFRWLLRQWSKMVSKIIQFMIKYYFYASHTKIMSNNEKCLFERVKKPQKTVLVYRQIDRIRKANVIKSGNLGQGLLRELFVLFLQLLCKSVIISLIYFLNDNSFLSKIPCSCSWTPYNVIFIKASFWSKWLAWKGSSRSKIWKFIIYHQCNWDKTFFWLNSLLLLKDRLLK